MNGSTPLFTSIELLETLGPLLCQPFPETLPEITGISIDTRTLKPGDLFIALEGQQTNGQTYLPQAFAQGASAALVQESDLPRCLHVVDINQALLALAQKARERASNLRTIAVTGSVGKTGTKEALVHVLSTFGNTHGSVASFNNHLGVPLSLARMPRETRFGVFEAGMNNPGELTLLSNLIQPHVALVTKIGAAHLGNFKSLTDIAHAKSEIFTGVLQDGYAVLHQNDPFFPFLRDRAKDAHVSRIITFGSHETSDIQLLEKDLASEGSWFKISYRGDSLEGYIKHPGEHWIANALGVLAVVATLEEDLALAFKQLETLPNLPGRGKKLSGMIEGKKITLFDESYNANPTSMTAALHLLGQQIGGRRVAILGDMLELGTEADTYHQALEKIIDAEDIDLVVTCGPHMQSLDRALPLRKRGGWFSTAGELIPILPNILREGDVVTIKGSRSMQLDHAVTFLTATMPKTF